MTSPASSIEIKIASDLQEVGRLRKSLELALRSMHLAPTLIQNALLSTTEWITNLIRHSKVSPTEICLRIQCTAEQILLTITDNGSHFSEYEHYVSESGHLRETLLPEGGMGLYLINQFFPSACYRRQLMSKLNEFTIPITVDLQKPAIAVIEDDKSLRLLICEYLKNDYQISEFPDGRSFLDAIENIHCDLVISDISMPNMDGLSLRRELASRQKTALIPFVFLTSHNDEQSETSANQLGIDDYLRKPVSKAQLRSVVQRILQRNKTNTKIMGALFDKEVTAALRPSLPEKFLNFNAVTVSRSAEAGGGDFIVSLPSTDQQHIILGDVMGHGLNAKFYAHLYAGYLQGALHHLGGSLKISESLSQVSDLIQQDPYLESVIVTCIGLTCYRNGDIVMANAAHPKPILIQSTGYEFLEINGALPGMNLSNHYDELRLSLREQRLLIYSDGLFEVGKTAQDMENSKNLLLSTIATTYQLPLQIAAETIMKQWELLSNERAQDDVTFILLGYEG